MRALTPANFVPQRYPVTLTDDEIQLWLFSACRDRRASDERVRDLLAAYLACAPADVTLRRGAHGKPYLAAPYALEFNVSHSAGALLVGISRGQPLGVDIESANRSRPVAELAGRFFAASEAAQLARLDAGKQQAAFLALWSCKEAVLKALGRGLGFGLSRLVFDIDACGEPVALNVIAASAGTAAEWQIAKLLPAPTLSGAVAWRGRERPIRAFTFAAAGK